MTFENHTVTHSEEWRVAAREKAFGLMTIGVEPCDQIHQEVDRTAMAVMLDLADVLELISDDLDDSSLA
jgi:hypothetical protein